MSDMKLLEASPDCDTPEMVDLVGEICNLARDFDPNPDSHNRIGIKRGHHFREGEAEQCMYRVLVFTGSDHIECTSLPKDTRMEALQDLRHEVILLMKYVLSWDCESGQDLNEHGKNLALKEIQARKKQKPRIEGRRMKR